MATVLPSRQQSSWIQRCWLQVFAIALSAMVTMPRERGFVTAVDETDFRTVSKEELLSMPSTSVYSSAGIVEFDRLLVDHARQQIIVGARNHLLRLDWFTLAELERLQWAADDVTVKTCLAKGQTEVDCHNYIRVMLLHSDRLFTCGTNAFSPRCQWRSPANLSTASGGRVMGVAMCPYSPRQNNTVMMTSSGDLYSGTVTDFAARDPAIYRSLGPSKHLRTVQYNTRLLNEPNFVSMYEIGDYVYVFFREVAIEYINCGKVIYSRVARVCKGDSGGNKFLLDDNWTTFAKARLNCSLPGAYPFYFNELQSTFYVESEQLIYAVFTTSPTSIYASAVCVYNLTAIDRVFAGPYKYQVDALAAWSRVPNPAPSEQCPNSGNDASGGRQRPLVDTQNYQLMDSAVQSASLQPLLVVEKQRFTHIVLDKVRVRTSWTGSADVTVMFLVTLEGSVHKMVVLPSNYADGAGSVCLVEKIHFADQATPRLIHSIQLLEGRKGALVVGTADRVFLIEAQRCSRFTTEWQCTAAQDPYCEWDEVMQLCTSSGNRNLSSCPQLDYTVDGGWSRWSTWMPCSHVDEISIVPTEQCLCRLRSCDSPSPRSGGRDCVGRRVEVTNCTVSGGWTSWSEWSDCSASCDEGSVRTRRRSCTNPVPRFGGRLCVGEEMQLDECSVPSCPPPVVDGLWSAWSSWSQCTNQCGHGFQTRTRLCNSPRPQNGGSECIGNDNEWQTCNMGACEEVRKNSEWTRWYRTNESGPSPGRYEERHRCVCRAEVADGSLLRPAILKTSTRHCSGAIDGCDSIIAVPDVDGSWASWTPWTPCTVPCDGGTQQRRRTCTSPAPSGAGQDCPGSSMDYRTCNVQRCVSQWTCWSEFTPCSVSCRSPMKSSTSWRTGFRTRRRDCDRPEGSSSAPCVGESQQTIGCDDLLPLCSTVATEQKEGGNWSPWSECQRDNVQRRQRPCTSCAMGVETEMRDCLSDDESDDLVLRTDTATRTTSLEDEGRQQELTNRSTDASSITASHLAVACVCCFTAGVFVTSMAMFVYRWYRHYTTGRLDVAARQRVGRAKPVAPNHYSCSPKPTMKSPPGYMMDCATYSSIDGDTEAAIVSMNKLTVSDATLKRNLMIKSSGSFNRTRLTLENADPSLL